MQRKYRSFLTILTFVLVLTSTIAYSALTSTLQLNAEARLRTVSDIRVTDIKFSSASGGTLQYESTYDVNTITSGFVLPTTESSITYKVKVTNNGTIDQTIYDILTQSSNNNGLYYEISGYNVRDVIGFKSTIEFYITYKTTTPSNDVINVVNRFNFKKVYHVTFETNGGSSINEAIKYEGVDLSLATYSSTKTGYTLSGWTDEQAGTTVKYNTNGTYTLDRDLILYAIWSPNPNTSYTVNHYVHDLGTNTYTLNSTDTPTGATDSTVTLANLKKTIAGFTYVDGYLTGNTTKPTSGAVTTTTILADGSRVVNLYYRRNYLYVQYHVNGGQLAEQHGIYFGVTNSLVTSTGNTTPNKFWVGVYGSKVNAVTNANTYAQGTAGLDNYNNPNYLNLEKTGYTGKSGQEWNTNASGTGTSYSQATTTYDANTFGGADLSTGDQVVTLYVNWVPVNYEIQYDLQGGTLATSNPATYNIETDTFTLNNPTLTGYTFTGWTGSNGNTPQTTVTIPVGSTGDKAYIANWQANTYDVTFDTNGGTIGANELFSFDGSTHTIDGTIVGATWGDDYLQFAGDNTTFVNLGQINSDYMTLQATFSVDETVTTGQVIIGNVESGGACIAVTQPTDDYVIMGTAYINNEYRRIYSNVVPEVGKKYNVLLSYDGKVLKLFIDNNLAGSIEIEGTIGAPIANTVMVLGGNPLGSDIQSQYFKGKIYSASIYSNPKKQVTYNSQYGTLPEPTRSNYVFKGWNGKNILNIPDKNISFTNNWYSQESANPNYIFKPSTDYTLTFDYDINLTDTYLASVGYGNTTYSKDIRSLGYNSTNAGKMVFRFTTPATFDYDPPYAWFRFVRRSSSGDADVDISNIQLEEGTTATPYEPYYVTSSTNVTQDKNHTLKAIWDLKESTFLQGQQFNAKIKQLAGNQDATYETANTNITSIVRSNSLNIMPIDDNVVSTPDSNTPIYAWFDNNSGTLYYYTDAVNIYMNSSAPYMFYNLRNATSIDLDDINTTKTTSMYGLFHSCINLSNLDLSNFDTSDVRSARAMFAYDSSLSSLDLSSFDLGKVNDTTFIFEGMTSLKTLQTPSVYPTDSSKKITLPKLMVDANGNEYTELNSSSLTETWLYTPATFLPGTEFNAKIKQLAGTSNATFNSLNTNITSIQRANTLPNGFAPTPANVVSTSDSYYPIYAWYDNGIIYYYTEYSNPYMNTNGYSMFRNLRNMTSINISTIDTSRTTNMSAMFYNAASLETINLSNFDTSNVSDMNNMFAGWDQENNSPLHLAIRQITGIENFNTQNVTNMTGMFNNISIESLDLSNWNTSNVTNMSSMFKACVDLRDLDISGFNMSSVTNTTYMLRGATSLQSIKTPDTYPTDSSVKITLPKLMIDASGNEYTELDNTSPTETMLYTPATFLPGQEFNAKIRQLAGNQDATYETADTNITSIVRSNTLSITPTSDNIVSTNDSYTPIYAWYDNGTIYYYTEYSNPYMNTNGSKMFYKLRNAVSIDVSTIKTSQTTNMWALFHDCYELTSLNLSSFNTSNVTTMQAMFANCRSLTSLNLSGFNTSNVTNMRDMFYYCTSLSELSVSNFNTSKVTTMIGMFNSCSNIRQLDLSNFDMGIVTGTDYMLTNMSSLESLKTPKVYPSEAVIQMPKTLYDSSGNSWSVLDSSAPTETWLHKMVCKRATTLHTETCSQTSTSLYCSGAGYTVGESKNTRTITYGSLGTNATTLNSGDAFTCDVNGDGVFNEQNERFYYVSDYYNTTTKQFESDTGVLVYYNNVSAGVANNTATYAYDASGENWHGPQTALLQLPTSLQWSNISLKNKTRAILTAPSTNTTEGGTLPNNFSYNGYSARLLTMQEINNSVNRGLSYTQTRLDDISPYLFENTLYSSSSLPQRWLLETVSTTNDISSYTILTTYSTTYTNGIYPGTVSSSYGVRPAIEVNKNFLNKKVNAYLITYDTNGGSENTTQIVTVGDSLGSLSVPTKEGYTFAGWYTEASGGTQITTATVPTATTTYYAHWTPIDYNITYDLDGGTVATSNPSTYNADSNSITLNNPTKIGYTFAGWSGGKNIVYFSNRNGVTSQTDLGSVTLEAGTYTISAMLNNNSNIPVAIRVLNNDKTEMIATSNYVEGNTNRITQANFVLNTDATVYIAIIGESQGYNVDVSSIQLEEGTTATSYEPYVSNETTLTIPSGSVGNRVYTANWEINKYYLTYDYLDNYSYDGVNALATGYRYDWTKDFKVEATFRIDTLGKRYAIFGNYDDRVNNLNVEVNATNRIRVYMGAGTYDNYSVQTIPANTDITLTYIWNASTKTYTLTATGTNVDISMNGTVSSMGGAATQNVFVGRDYRDYVFNPITISMFKISTKYDYNTTVTSLPIATKTGYTYSGWYDASTGGNNVISVTIPANDTTVYAHKTPINYNITYDLDGGTVATSNPSTYNADSNSITLNNPTKTGYTFAGWSGGKNLLNLNIQESLPSSTSHSNSTSRTFTSNTYVKGLAYNNYYQREYITAFNINNNQISLTTRNGYGIAYPIVTSSNKQYVLSYIGELVSSDSGGTSVPIVSVMYYKEDGTLIDYNETSGPGYKEVAFTTPTDTYYLVMSFSGNGSNTTVNFSNIKLEEGTTATTYEPYVDKQTTVTIPSGSTGNRKYTANWIANTYTVTADANGGSIPSTNGWTGTGNAATKSVTYDSQYGTLPTPTRNGYTFKGWNGKNLLNINIAETTKNGLIASVNNNLIRIEGENTNHSNDYAFVEQKEDLPQLINGTRYTLSTYNKSTGESYIQLNYFKENDQTQYPLIRVESGVGTFTVYNDYFKTYAFFIGIKKTVTSIDEEFRIQLEEGTTATPYEPYYVTSSTNVTQDKNHTLKAIWEMDTYEIQYDLQGGTLASSNPATYNVETNTFTLNNPTLTGQTFIGWTGSNGNTPELNVTIPVGSYGDKAYVANFSPIYEPETRIRSLNTIGTSIADDDPDSNLRYIGSNPNNYVSFNGQKWRIIGIFDGKLKIIGDSIGNYSWDTSRNTVNNGYGVNQWGVSGTYTGADLMKLLNPGYSTNTDLKCNTTVTVTDGVANCGDNTDSNYTTGLVNNSLYWNASSGYCYNYGNYKTTSCDFSTSGLQSDTTRNMIDNATWYLGSNLASDNIWDGRMTASYLYNIERSNNTGKQCSGGDYCNDDVTRTTTWQGKVGLLYPSDYIYATGGGSTYNRNTCLTVHAGSVSDNSVSNWNNTYTDCKNNDWLLPSSWIWSLSPRAFSSISRNVFNVTAAGIVDSTYAMNAGSVRPVVYLKSSIKFTTGDGSFNSPFNLIDTE